MPDGGIPVTRCRAGADRPQRVQTRRWKGVPAGRRGDPGPSAARSPAKWASSRIEDQPRRTGKASACRVIRAGTGDAPSDFVAVEIDGEQDVIVRSQWPAARLASRSVRESAAWRKMRRERVMTHHAPSPARISPERSAPAWRLPSSVRRFSVLPTRRARSVPSSAQRRFTCGCITTGVSCRSGINTATPRRCAKTHTGRFTSTTPCMPPATGTLRWWSSTTRQVRCAAAGAEFEGGAHGLHIRREGSERGFSTSAIPKRAIVAKATTKGDRHGGSAARKSRRSIQ